LKPAVASLRDFMRFAFDWQHLSAATRLQGQAALDEVLEQLEGFAAVTAAWEDQLLADRLKDYSPRWLEDPSRCAHFLWARLAPTAKGGVTLRSAPLAPLPRVRADLWRTLSAAFDPARLSPRAQRVHAALAAHGALLFDELAGTVGLLRIELETALQELLATGLASADSFAGPRALITPPSKLQASSSRRGRGPLIGGMDDAGYWALLSQPANPRADGVEQCARALLRRYGVVAAALLEREADGLPSWRELLPSLHGLAARREIQAGRFVEGLTGEQFAVPRALELLQEVRERPLDASLVAISASDPLNLLGSLLPGPKVPALPGNRLVFRDGVAAAAIIKGKPVYWQTEDAPLRAKLLRNL
jgi:ATP-dependent Lhr-like helicase